MKILTGYKNNEVEVDKKNYYDFAMNDFTYLQKFYKDNDVSNIFCYATQNTCERFLKHIIDTEYNPENKKQKDAKTDIIKSHSINRLLKFIEKDMGIEIDGETRSNIKKCDGYYFSTRYPGEDSFFADKEDIEECQIALLTTKEFVDNHIEQIKNINNKNNINAEENNKESEPKESEENITQE